jgi:hypothetical protein
MEMGNKTLSDKAQLNQADLLMGMTKLININLNKNLVKEHFLKFIKELMYKVKIKKNMQSK